MSSKLVKKGLELVSSTDTPVQQTQKAKRNKKLNQRQRNAPYTSGKHSKKGKQKIKDQDFTEQNLQYFTSSVWSMKKDIYEKIVQNQEKRKKTVRDAEESEDKDE